MYEFYCPFCSEKLSYLNGEFIKLKGRMTSDTFDCITNFYLSGKIGQYDAYVDDFVVIKPGVMVEFVCPNLQCSKSLNSNISEELAEIVMRSSQSEEKLVLFNRTFGQQATFILDSKTFAIESAYGKDQEKYRSKIVAYKK